MRLLGFTRRTAAGVAIVAFACTADKPGSMSSKPDAAAIDELEPPALESVPTETPMATVAVRGNTEGERVVLQVVPGGTLTVPVLPGGSFCSDVALDESEPTEIHVYAARQGALSEPIDLTVRADPEAPTPANPTCSGMIDPACGDSEICDNDIDDDCNSYADDCDLACSGCVDDAFEPNDDPVDVPSLSPGSYQLDLCPCRDDWFAFQREANERVRVTASFDHSTIDVDLRLYRAGPSGSGTEESLAGSFSSTDEEEIDHIVDADGVYFLRVYPFSSTKREGSYTLTIL